jgi:hypothetical protein
MSTGARTTMFHCATSILAAPARCRPKLARARNSAYCCSAWLRAGEALEHILLEITANGYVASPFTALIEVAPTNAALRDELELAMFPHILLRVGRAPSTPASRRRRLGDMLDGIPLDGAVGSLENPIAWL